MLKELLNRRVAAAALVPLLLAACASTSPARATRSTAAANPPISCVATPTGLLAAPRDCPANGHVWTQRDIDRTGAQTTAGALRLLDPTITVTGH